MVVSVSAGDAFNVDNNDSIVVEISEVLADVSLNASVSDVLISDD